MTGEPLIREAQEGDAMQMIKFMQQLATKTAFMLKEPGEQLMSVEQQQSIIKQILLSMNSILLIAQSGDELIGFLGARGGQARRNRYCARYIIVICKTRDRDSSA